MAILITLQGPDAGRTFPLDGAATLIGRQFDSSICLAGKQVSRHHAQVLERDANYYVEDLDSSNGTYLNGKRIPPHVPTPISERDTLQIGPYLFALRPAPTVAATEPSLVVREQVNAASLTQSIYTQDPAVKLQVVLELAQHLARTLEIEPLIDKLNEHLMKLFPQADRSMVLLCEGDRLVVRGQHCRRAEDATIYPYSRTIVKKALDDGVGILSEDVRADQRFLSSSTLTSLDLHSLLCVPLIGQGGKRLGIIQVDRFRRGLPFRVEDLHLVTTISLQVAMVLELASLHAERIREERLQQELAFAREIQQGFLPSELEGFPQADFEIFGRVFPARQVAGDLYDFMRVPGERLAFFVGDVSGKGMPEALFMVAVRTLCVHLEKDDDCPAQTMRRLNVELAADNPSGMFVTLAHGVYQPASGGVLLSSGGHPAPLLRRVDGTVEQLTLTAGRLLGFEDESLQLADVRLDLKPGEMLIFYTDGVTEARTAGSHDMLGINGLIDVARGFTADVPLEACAEKTHLAVERFSRTAELQDDVTLLLLRRK